MKSVTIFEHSSNFDENVSIKADDFRVIKMDVPDEEYLVLNKFAIEHKKKLFAQHGKKKSELFTVHLMERKKNYNEDASEEDFSTRTIDLSGKDYSKLTDIVKPYFEDAVVVRGKRKECSSYFSSKAEN